MMDKMHVLDRGFVQLLDVMGDDQSIVDAARVSISGVGMNATSDTRGLIRYLMRHGHTTPFEMCELKFHVKLPIFVARQWMRHRTWSYNEMSGRYSQLPEEFYVPELKDIKYQATKNKQGRGDETDHVVGNLFIKKTKEIMSKAFGLYKGFIGKGFEGNNILLSREFVDEMKDKGGVARELARISLPVATYTEFYAKVDLHNLLHFLRLRMHEHAQYEIKVYADAISTIVENLFPITWEAFVDYKLEGIFLSKQDIEAFISMKAAVQNLIDSMKIMVDDVHKTKREYEEFVQKMERFNVKL